jgi:hypothetical protein
MDKMRWAVVLAALALAACNELPQETGKPYAGKTDTKPYADDQWKGDKAKYEKALADRAKYQDDYSQSRAYK